MQPTRHRLKSTSDIRKQNKAIVDIRLRPRSGAAPGGSVCVYATVLYSCYFLLSHYCVAYSWPVCANITSSIKPGRLWHYVFGQSLRLCVSAAAFSDRLAIEFFVGNCVQNADIAKFCPGQ